MTYVALVLPRWSDMDVYGHVNHANLVTLLEEARIPLLFGESVRQGLSELSKGMVVVSLQVRYRAPIVVSGQKIRVEISLKELKYASCTLTYKVHRGPSEEDKVAVTAETVLAPYDVVTERPRRLTDPEREFLRRGLTGA
ncbi:acyl-CoA thioesterase [Amycolatopsis sp. H20-H5]|uniref:acyl-CoA thioesterase n=1 Tax=Amycolatopsis sp. H20-H5 TaxID=3046309 RepID=UPI002DB651A6|nr:thioesterase family protein [Amycolatopsis sp. H20-H5]MEC3978436.1 thioesterase family protein [Amycolatopsis sp. H20-H5]